MNESAAAAQHKKMTKRQQRWIAVALLICFGLGAWIAGRNLSRNAQSANAQTDESARPMPVSVMTLAPTGEIHLSRTYTGVIRAEQRSDLGFEIAGTIKQFFVDEGDQLSVNTPIAALDTDSLEARKQAIVAQLAQAKSILAELESGPREETIAAARAVRDAAHFDVELAKSSFQRRARLFDQAAISQDEFEQSKFGLQSAQARLESAQEQLDELESGTRQEQIDAQQAAVRQLEASLAEIDVTLRKSVLQAPFAGTISQRYLDPGSIAAPGTPVVRVVSSQNLEARIGLPADIVAKLQIGDRHDLLVDQQKYPATLIAKLKEIDPTTRTQTVLWKLNLDQNKDLPVSGQLCEIEIEQTMTTTGFWVPHTALTKGIRGLWSVMALAPESATSNQSSPGRFRVEKRDVEVIRTETNRVLVRGTVSAQDRIVREGVHRIANGQTVVEARD